MRAALRGAQWGGGYSAEAHRAELHKDEGRAGRCMHKARQGTKRQRGGSGCMADGSRAAFQQLAQSLQSAGGSDLGGAALAAAAAQAGGGVGVAGDHQVVVGGGKDGQAVAHLLRQTEHRSRIACGVLACIACLL